jgi:hypothetical protein
MPIDAACPQDHNLAVRFLRTYLADAGQRKTEPWVYNSASSSI